MQDTLRILSKLFELQVEWPVQLQAYIEIILIESWQFFAKLDTIVIGSFFVVALHDFVDRYDFAMVFFSLSQVC